MSIDSDKIRFFEREIMTFYGLFGRTRLPWRKEEMTAYGVWVSEIMLQQTQVSRVIGYYERFMERFPTVSDLARADWEDFLPYYAGLGYYRRGRNMLLAAQAVVEEYGGEFPHDKKSLMSLPGVGDYTAAAVLSFAYGEDHIAWDTNLRRVIGRFFFGSRFSEDQSLRFGVSARDLNAALMDFGSLVCLGRPKCAECPLVSRCSYAFDQGASEKSIVAKRKAGARALSGALNPEGDSKTDWKKAKVLLWLHREHKAYYSSESDRFEPFALSLERNDRADIKAYFKDRYGLDIAVRPPHDKTMLRGEPVIFVNAQILLGEPRFAVFSKEVVKRYNDSIFDA